MASFAFPFRRSGATAPNEAAPQSNRKEGLALLLGFAALVGVAAATVWLVYRTSVYNDAVATTLQTKTEIVRTLSIAQDAETGQRGFMLTSDARYLRPYEAAVEQLGGHLSKLRALIGENDEQSGRLHQLELQLEEKFAELAETVALQRQGKIQDARALVETDRGRNAMRNVRRLVSEMLAGEDVAFDKRSHDAERGTSALLMVVVLGLMVAAGLAYLAQTIMRRQTNSLRAAQTELESANAGLEAAVAERTADLVSANEEIQRFAYIVSHDLRAPLVNVMGFTSELDAARRDLKDQLDAITREAPDTVRPETRVVIEEDLPEAIGFIRTSTAKMDRLINAILRLSREGRRVVTPESVSVMEVSTAIAATLRQQTWAAGAEIVVETGAPPLVTDRLAIEQVFQNLIENAVKYLDKSRPGRIVVRGRRIGSQVEYWIQDNGRGIDPKDHERVFELFRRAGAQDQPGEGLGLAFVRATVRRLGGTIRLTSEPGTGSTFHLTFPAVFRLQAEQRAA